MNKKLRQYFAYRNGYIQYCKLRIMNRKPILLLSMLILFIPLIWNLILILVANGAMDMPTVMSQSLSLGSPLGWLIGAIPFLESLGIMLIVFALLFSDEN